MPIEIKLQYSSPATLTWTLNSLVSGAARSSARVDNTVNRYIDVLVQLKAIVAAGSPSSGASLQLYAYGVINGDTPLYPGSVDGTDANVSGFTSQSTTTRFVSAISVNSSGTFVLPPVSLAAAFGGVLPPYWGLVLFNSTGLSLEVSGSYGEWIGVKEEVLSS